MKTAHAIVYALAVLAAATSSSQPIRAESAPLVISEVPVRADRVVVLALHVRGSRAIAVGERGTVLVSENGGADWKSFRSQKTTRTLTSVVALDDKTWLGAGHGGVMLRSENAGKSAQIVETDAGADSFLGLTVVGPGTVLAYGAFGLMLRSDDAGLTWKRHQVVDRDFDRHINRVIASNDMLLLVGESGALAKSIDGGVTWTRMESPYEGSFFGASVTPGGAILIFGMRGNVYRSADQGVTWSKIDVPTKLPFFGAANLRDKRIVLTAGHGWLGVSEDDGRSFRLRRIAPGSVAGAFERSDGALVTYGEQGIHTVQARMRANDADLVRTASEK
jgi:photosystem II stability/assembly factor-like uncharacterized protein